MNIQIKTANCTDFTCQFSQIMDTLAGSPVLSLAACVGVYAVTSFLMSTNGPRFK